MVPDDNDQTLPSNKIVRALDRALDVLGTPGKQAVFDEIVSEQIDWEKGEDSVMLDLELFFKQRFEKGASYLISRVREELARGE